MRLFDQVDFYHAFSEASAINILSYNRFLYDGPDLIKCLWPHLRVEENGPDLTRSSGDFLKSIVDASKTRTDISKSHINPSKSHVSPLNPCKTYASKSGNTYVSKSDNTYVSKSGNTFVPSSHHWYNLLKSNTTSTNTTNSFIDSSASNTDSGSTADSLGSDNGKVNWPEIKTNFIDFIPPVFIRNSYLRARKKAEEEFIKSLKDTKLKGKMHSPSTGLAFGWKKKNIGVRKKYGFFYDKYVTTEGPSQCEEVIEEVIIDNVSTSESDIDEELINQMDLDTSRHSIDYRSSSHIPYTTSSKHLGTSMEQPNPFMELLQFLCCGGT
ncbi:hypothetical protein KUTeg_002388 [Tegillarca granosa]|uniref:Uncharacterized protein n=1 Tax=Tegillarca granosa TaxID=220873 RepID=A0ABQ9FXD6_TEGGR|nr:hypothetical protein KUTeg_002388 [Tegillarca granosa]